MSTRLHITLVNRVRFCGRRPRNRRQFRKRLADRRNYQPDLRPWETTISYGALDTRTGQPWTEQPKPPRLLEMHPLTWERFKKENPETAARCDVFERILRGTPTFSWYDERQVWPKEHAGRVFKMFDERE